MRDVWKKLGAALISGTEDTPPAKHTAAQNSAQPRKTGLAALFRPVRIDAHYFEQLQEQLIRADISVKLAIDLVSALRKKKYESCPPDESLTHTAKAELLRVMTGASKKIMSSLPTPFIVMVSGVNGSGKTTTIGKLSHYWQNLGYSVGMVAGDNFRSAAVEQLEIWAVRTGAQIFMPQDNQRDPAALVYQAIEKTCAQNAPDILIIDTAGRLHSNQALMDSLEKIPRVIKKLIPDAPHESLLVLDGTTGQNSLTQAQAFMAKIPVSGMIMTKLDGTAKGGMIPSLMAQTQLPVYFLGVGEAAADLLEFDAEQFIDALFGIAAATD